ncbi:tRNA lysidine(34) synthetase TilS [Spiroplasma taiwanense]|uniref:tRNA(Ile)-lysidine synthase n=1 Tax=Spiroplasma taiwanense CT-1 TaxID=1276220 RepID=S5LSS7_9MOLU|nr:tRNA lysidine(34) synthetase TilS [Spiroplasma taiwanense]AGR40709.1 tRNA(Ile)-lysidine synthase [Spiroplasma taiwanense CT-1]
MKLEKKEKYIVALSGGPDSIFLLNYLLQKKITNLIACHVNYNFRKDSLNDQIICENICKLNNIKLETLNIISNYKNLTFNFESWAREKRYNFFQEISYKYNINKVLVAHNLNDHVETFLMQKQKKSLVNYYGIEEKIFFDNLLIIRPILKIKKKSILKYLSDKKIKYAIDSTNTDLNFLRNKIRSNLKNNQLKKFILIIKKENKKLKKIKKSIQKKINKGFLQLNDFVENEEYNLRLLFNFFEFKKVGSFFYKTKKAIIKEILKQIMSKKSFIKIQLDFFVIIKDYNFIYIFEKNKLNIFEKTLVSTEKKMKFNINLNRNFDIIITNDWEKWQSKVFYGSKKLSDYYKKNKISYIQRYKNILIFSKTNKIVLNKLN